MLDKLVQTVWLSRPDAVVLGTAALTFTIGVFLARPFPVLSQSVSYRFLAQLPENFWAFLFIAVGSSKIVVCLLHELLVRLPGWRWLPGSLNVATFVMWLVVFSGIYLSNPDTMGTPVYFFVALAPAWCAAMRFRQADAARRADAALSESP